MAASPSARSAKFALISSSRARLSSFGSVASNRSASFRSLCNAPARRCKAKLCLNTRSASAGAASGRMHHQFGIFAAALKIRSRSGPRPAPFSHSASAADEISASAGAASSASRNAFTPGAHEFGRRQFLEMALDQRRVAERDREDHGFARRQASAAAELALRAPRALRRRPCAVRSGGTARRALGRKPVSRWNSLAPAARVRRRRTPKGAASYPPGSAGAAARRRFC